MTPTLERQGHDATSTRLGCNGQVLSLWRGLVPTRPIVMQEIAEQIAAMHGLSVGDLKGPSRIRIIAGARHHAMWAMSKHPHLSLTMIGWFLGCRDHGTVCHGIKRHQERLDAQAVLEAA